MNLLKSAVGVFAGFEGIKAVVNFGQDCVASFNTGEQATTQLQSVLKSTGGAAGETQSAAENLASSLSGLTTFTKPAVLSGEDLLLTFTKIGSKIMPQATETVLNMSQALGQDTKDSAIQLGKALNDPITGMTALSRVGVTFSAGQKTQITAMEKSGNLMGAQKIILSELNTEFGNSAKAMANTPEGRVKQLNNAWDEVKETIGGKLVPVVTSCLNIIGDNIPRIEGLIMGVIGALTPAFNVVENTIIPGVGKAIQNLMPTFSKTGQVVKDIVNFVVGHKQEVIAAIIGIGSAIAGIKIAQTISGIIGSIKKVKEAVEGLKGLSAVGKIFSTIFGLPPQVLIFIAVIAVIAGLAYLIIKNWGPISKFFEKIWTDIKITTTGAFKEIGDTITNAFDSVKAFLTKWGPDILIVIAPFIGIPLLIYQHWSQISTDLGKIWSDVKSTVASGVSGVSSTIINGFNSAISFIKSLPALAIGWGKDFISGLAKGVTGAAGAVTGAVTGVANKIKSVLHFSVPDSGPLTKYASWMPDMLKGMGQGLKVNANLVLNPIQDIAVGIKNKLTATNKQNPIALNTSKLVTGSNSSNKVSNENGGSGDFIYSPQITIQGNASKDDVTQALTMSIREFARLVALYKKNKGRVSFT